MTRKIINKRVTYIYILDKNHNGQAASEVCDICNSAPKRHFCIECAQHFCDYCKGLHTRQTATRQHEFQDSSEIKQNGKCNCMKYDEDCISICDDCHVLVCSRCGAGKEGKHDGHKVCNLNERISMLNTIVKEEIETSLQKDFIILNELENGVDAYDSEVKSVIKGIREDEQKMKQMIDEKVKSMLDDIKMKTSCEKNKMAKLVTDTKSRIETKTALEDRRKHIRKEIPNLAVFYDMTTLHERFSQIGIVISPSYPSIDYKPNKASGIKMLSVLGSYMLRYLFIL